MGPWQVFTQGKPTAYAGYIKNESFTIFDSSFLATCLVNHITYLFPFNKGSWIGIGGRWGSAL